MHYKAVMYIGKYYSHFAYKAKYHLSAAEPVQWFILSIFQMCLLPSKMGKPQRNSSMQATEPIKNDNNAGSIQQVHAVP